MPIIYRIQHLTKTYKGSTQKANDDLTFDIREGEIFGLLGPNGAGKSTLLGQITGLLRPSSGSVSLFGFDALARADLISHYVAVQPQRMTALAKLYPAEAIYYTGVFRGLTPADARKQTAQLVEAFELQKIKKTCLNQLSGGEQKLVAFAVTLIGNRPVQIFDEPTNELDPKIRRVVWEKLQQQNREGTTIILVTHNVLEAERVIQRVGIISHGRLMALGTLGELKARIDQRVRLELHLKDEYEHFAELLSSLGDAHLLTKLHGIVLCHRDVVQASINSVLTQIGLDQIDDFRILTPSLEDVYLESV
jgi:ABC-2 type transport system ATP-binding protein